MAAFEILVRLILLFIVTVALSVAFDQRGVILERVFAHLFITKARASNAPPRPAMLKVRAQKPTTRSSVAARVDTGIRDCVNARACVFSNSERRS